MQRITITIDNDLMAEVERFMQMRGYEARSEVFRDLLRAGLEQVNEDSGGAGECVAALTYVYDHEMRGLAKRLCDTGHEHHDLVQTTAACAPQPRKLHGGCDPEGENLGCAALRGASRRRARRAAWQACHGAGRNAGRSPCSRRGSGRSAPAHPRAAGGLNLNGSRTRGADSPSVGAITVVRCLRHRFETDTQAMAGGFGIAAQSFERGPVRARFEPGYDRLRGIHAFGDFGLAEAG